MNHEMLIAVLMLVSIPPLLVIMWWSKKGLQEIDWDRREKRKLGRIEAMLPHAVQLWKNLFMAIQDKKTEEEIKRCVDEVSDYIKLMSQV